MKTMLNFLKERRNERLTLQTFTEVDSLILSQLVYLNIEAFAPFLSDVESSSLYISNINIEENLDLLVTGTFFPSSNKQLLKLLKNCLRYKGLKVNYWQNLTDEEKTIQFTACTFFVNDVTYVCFRGTDCSLIGWEENFNMALYKVIPAQDLAVKYLDKVGERISGQLIVGGHSKGGNLAQFSSVFCKQPIQNRIIKVYNHDGPGFHLNIFSSDEYIRIASRIEKSIPYGSFIGNLFNNFQPYKTVKCNSFFLIQHNPFNWGVRNGKFIQKKHKGKITQTIAKSLIEWVNTLNMEERNIFIRQLFELFYQSNINSVTDFKKKTISKLVKMKKEYEKLPEKKMIAEKLGELIKVFKKNLRLARLTDKRDLTVEFFIPNK